MPGLDESREFVPLKIAVLTVSDTRNLKDDKSGALLVQCIVAAGHLVAERSIVNDDVEAIRDCERLDRRSRGRCHHHHRRHRLYRPRRHAGGDRAAVRKADGRLFVAFPHAEPRQDRHLDDASRATAGVAGATFIFCLPGSPGACRDGWDGILAAQLDYRTRPCNFVEIMPRLDEHLRRPKPRGRPFSSHYNSKSQCSLTTERPQLRCRSVRTSLKPDFR